MVILTFMSIICWAKQFVHKTLYKPFHRRFLNHVNVQCSQCLLMFLIHADSLRYFLKDRVIIAALFSSGFLMLMFG